MKKYILFLVIIIYNLFFSIYLLDKNILANVPVINEKNSNINKNILEKENIENKNNFLKYEMRGVWVPTVLNLNMPAGMNKQEFETWAEKLIENLENYNFNAVNFQIRPTADALYKSKIVPWSFYITGKKQGVDPLYDPLEILIEKAHSKGIELHAWLNPYRVTINNTDLTTLDKDNIAIKHPDWLIKYGKAYYLNPGILEVQNHLIEVIKEIVDNYDIDAIHFDDYFYPYPIKGEKLLDEKEFKKYGKNFKTIEDWRRNNVTNLIKNLNDTIKSSKKYVQFGISPFGIWQNYNSNIEGSNTNGFESYNNLFGDALDWLKKGIIDYLAPQIYWSTSSKSANFVVLKDWWSKQIAKNTSLKPVNLYIGIADYKVGEDSDKEFSNQNQLLDQINLIRNDENIKGQMHYSYLQVIENKLNHTELIRKNLYNYKALVPQTPCNDKTVPKAPKDVKAIKSKDGILLKISKEGNYTRKYSIYRFEENEKEIYENKNLLNVCYKSDLNTFLDKTAKKDKTYKYGIKAISFMGIESLDTKLITIKN